MTDILQNTSDEVRLLMEMEKFDSVKDRIAQTPPADIALMLHSFEIAEARSLFHLISNETVAAEVLSELEKNEIVSILEGMEAAKIAALLSKNETDDIADILSVFPAEKANNILKGMKREESIEVKELLKYGPDTAGGIMNPDVFHMDEMSTVAEAITQVNRAREFETVFYIYTTDTRGRLAGVVSLREVILAKSTQKLKEIANANVVYVNATVDQEEVARLVAQYNFLAVPVVEGDRKLVGIITVDDVIDVLREEATEDILKMAGSGREELSSRNSFKSAKSRLPWLFICWIEGILTIKMIDSFENTLKAYVALAAFIPIINSMSGNVGSQSVALIVRGLSTKKIGLGRIWSIIYKEIRVGIILGLVYAVLLSLLAIYQFPQIAHLGWVVGISLCICMVVGTLVGSLIPLLFETIGIDPAIASGPFVTTSIDLLSILLFFSTAHVILP